MFDRYIGIDISKSWFDIHLDQKVHRVLQKDAMSFIKTHACELTNALCVMESTGGYEIPLARALRRHGFTVHIAHPNQVVAFMRARNRLAKTDTIDARLLSDFGAFIKPAQIRPLPSQVQIRLANMSSHLSQLKSMRHQEYCRAIHPNKSDTFLAQSSQKILSLLDQEIASCEEEMMTLIKANAELKQTLDIVMSMPGIGHCSALSLLADLSEIGQLSAKEIAALLGVAPITKESGIKRGQARIQYGCANVRKILYMAALVACRYNPTMKEFYERLIHKGKQKKVAIIAVLRKMIVILNAMVKTKTMWKNHKTSAPSIAL